MPTVRQRHMITETDDVARALDQVAHAFPGLSRAELVRQLALIGAETVASNRAERAGLVASHAGRHGGMYGPDYLEKLRNEWPA